MPFTPSERKSLHAALLAAFSRADLEQLADFHLDQHLDAIAGSGPLQEVIHKLLQWSERAGREQDLLAAALAANPTNPALRSCVEAIRARLAMPTPAPAASPPVPRRSGDPLPSGGAVDYDTCFISYSSRDQAFAERLYADLQAHGVRVWYAPHNMKIGDRIRPAIDQAISVYDKLLVVLSQNSIASAWVENEVEAAFARETAANTVLFPIRLDDAVLACDQAWAATIRRTRHIGDFSAWRDPASYQVAFTRVLRDLQRSTSASP